MKINIINLEKDAVQNKAAGLQRQGRIYDICNRSHKTRQRSYMPHIFPNKRGDGYIDVVVAVLVSMMLLVLSLNVFSFLTVKQDMDYFAKEMVECATVDGRTNSAIYTRYYELADEVGFYPSYTWTADYYNSSYKQVQYGDAITVKLTYRTYVQGFGIFKIPIILTANYSGLSQKYWK